jgi:hypothetical protein
MLTHVSGGDEKASVLGGSGGWGGPVQRAGQGPSAWGATGTGSTGIEPGLSAGEHASDRGHDKRERYGAKQGEDEGEFHR